MTVKSFNSKTAGLVALKGLLTESNIPFLVDINEFDKLTPAFQSEINKNYVISYNNQNQ